MLAWKYRLHYGRGRLLGEQLRTPDEALSRNNRDEEKMTKMCKKRRKKTKQCNNKGLANLAGNYPFQCSISTEVPALRLALAGRQYFFGNIKV